MNSIRHSSHRTIALLTANIHIGAARSLWRGALDGAQARNANLICFPGGRLGIAEDFEAERNVLYNLLDLDHLDGQAVCIDDLFSLSVMKRKCAFTSGCAVPCRVISTL